VSFSHPVLALVVGMAGIWKVDSCAQAMYMTLIRKMVWRAVSIID